MYIDLLEIARGLQEKFSVEIHNIPTAWPIADLKFLPHAADGSAAEPEPENAYICEYRDLKFLKEETPAPLVCIVNPRTHPEETHFAGFHVVVVYQESVNDVLLELTRIMYVCGNRSSQILDISQELLRCSSIDALLDAAWRFLGNPLILTDTNQKILACTPSEKVPDAFYAQTIKTEYIPVGHPAVESAGTSRFAADIPFLDAGESGLPTVLCKELYVGESRVGYLHLLSVSHPVHPEDAHVVELLGNLLTIELWKRPGWSRMASEEQIVSFLRDILDDKFESEEQLRERQEHIGLKLHKYLYTVMIKLRRAEAVVHISLYELARQFAAAIPDTIGFLYQNSIILLHSSKAFRQDMTQLLSPIVPTLEQYHLAAGVSNPVITLPQLRSAAFQSNITLNIGTVLSENAVLEYKDCMYYHLIAEGLRSNPVENFIPPELIALLEYCGENDDTLLDTLQVYLLCRCNRTAAAEMLYIHQNTLRYRILQIEKIMGIDLKEGDNATRMSFALQVLDYAKHFL